MGRMDLAAVYSGSVSWRSVSRRDDIDVAGLRALRVAVLAMLDPTWSVRALAVAGPGTGTGRLGVADLYALAVDTEPGGWPTDAGAARAPRPIPGGRAGVKQGRTGGGRTTGRGSGRGGGRGGADNEAETQRVIDLVDRAREGDSHAFGQLYEKYVDAVHRFIYYRVNDPALAEDLTSDTFVRALRRIGSFTWQGRDFAAWLITIARNLVTDHFKSSRTRLERPTGEMHDADEIEEGPEDAVIERLSNQVLREAVAQLSPQQQECVYLRFMRQMSVAETAAIMGKNEGAIKTLQYRAVRTLARMIPESVR